MTTTRRWVSPAGTTPGSRPTMRTPYGTSTRSRNQAEAKLSQRSGRA
nr:hypothetical protein [Sphaerisporangium fuscum]